MRALSSFKRAEYAEEHGSQTTDVAGTEPFANVSGSPKGESKHWKVGCLFSAHVGIEETATTFNKTKIGQYMRTSRVSRARIFASEPDKPRKQRSLFASGWLHLQVANFEQLLNKGPREAWLARL